jgi:hypothetical protein
MFVHERLTWPLDQAGAWHIHEAVTEDYCRQLVAETRIITDSGKPQWIERSRQNHYLDCEAMAAAAGFMLNVHHIRATRRRTRMTTRRRPVPSYPRPRQLRLSQSSRGLNASPRWRHD